MFIIRATLSYLTGIALGRVAWHLGWIDCAFPHWLWPLPLLALLSLLPLSARLQRQRKPAPLRWPADAGFRPPRPALSAPVVAAAGLCLLAGMARFAAHPLEPCLTPADLAYYNLPADRAFERDAPQVTIHGVITGYPLVSDTRQRIDVTARQITIGGVNHPVDGRFRFTTDVRRRYQYGQPIRVQGRLVTPPEFEDFSYKNYLARKGLHSLLYSPEIHVLGAAGGSRFLRGLYGFRARGEAVLNRLLPEPYAALANGMLLGIEAGIPEDLYDKFNLTGTSHVIVISGSNVALIAGVFLAMGTRLLGRKRAFIPALAGIFCFALLVGGDAAVMRAAFMGSLYVYATAIGRRSTALVSLAFACWVMTLINPLTLWDVGFQLSSAATAGLILFSPAVNAGFDELIKRVRKKLPHPHSPNLKSPNLQFPNDQSSTFNGQLPMGWARALVEDGLLITIAANLTTLPLVVFYFGRLSVVSFLTNLLIAPVQAFIMLWGSLGVLLGAAGLEPLARAALLVPWLSLVWTVAMVEWTAALPGASVEVRGFGPSALVLTYLGVFGLRERLRLRGWWQSARSRITQVAARTLAGPVALGVAGCATVVIWAAIPTLPDGRLHLYFLDIGQGDGILIETPSGRQVLVDGGASPQLLFAELGDVMPFWDREIDLLLLTHPDADHMAAQIDAPTRFRIHYALDTGVSQANPDAQPWRDALGAAGAMVHVQHAGGWIDLGDGVALHVLWPPPGGFAHEHADNENSLVVRLVYGEFSALLTGDAGLASEEAWLRAGVPLRSTVLKVGHHGSKGSSGADFVAAVDPLVAVIQVGTENDYGHPAQDVLETLAGRAVLRNDLHGRIHVWSDGGRVWVGRER